MAPAIDIPKVQIAAFCVRNRIRRLALFGSVLRSDFGPDSDIDVLVEFEPNTPMGIWDCPVSNASSQRSWEAGGLMSRPHWR